MTRSTEAAAILDAARVAAPRAATVGGVKMICSFALVGTVMVIYCGAGEWSVYNALGAIVVRGTLGVVRLAVQREIESIALRVAAGELPGATAAPVGAVRLSPESGCSGFVLIRNEQLLYVHEEPEYPGVYFPANESCCDDIGACDSDFLAAARAALGAVGPLAA